MKAQSGPNGGPSRFVVLKVGGSLLNRASKIPGLRTDMGSWPVCWVVVGGTGPIRHIANGVLRDAGIRSETPDHRDQRYRRERAAAANIWTQVLGGELAETIEEIEILKGTSRPIVVDLDAISRSSLPEIATLGSDAAAALVAHRLGNHDFIKVTDVSGVLDESGRTIRSVSAAVLSMRSTCLEREAASIVEERGMACWITSSIVDRSSGTRVVSQGKASRNDDVVGHD